MKVACYSICDSFSTCSQNVVQSDWGTFPFIIAGIVLLIPSYDFVQEYPVWREIIADDMIINYRVAVVYTDWSLFIDR
jgi:hypothetical protein